jgi:hypothetical protein
MTDLVTVLWKPRQTIARMAGGNVKTAALVLTVIGIDFALSLGLLPAFVAAASKAATLSPGLESPARWIIVVISIGFTSWINIFLSFYLALILYFAMIVFGGTGSPRKVFQAILIGSAPTVFSRAIRVLLYVLKVTPSIRPGIISLGALIPGALTHVVRIGSLIDMADFWSLALVAYGFGRISGLRYWVSFSLVAVLWCGSEGLSIRLQMLGAV